MSLRLADLCPALLLLAATLSVIGCGPVEADHPLDPATPYARQQPSRISGRLALPAGPTPDIFARCDVVLWQALIDDPIQTVDVDVGGLFRFDAVVPGLYRLEPRCPDLVLEPLIITVPPAEEIDLGRLALAPALGVVEGIIVDEADTPIGDARVDVNGFAARTDATGRFDLTAPAGAQSIRVTADGFAPGRQRVNVVAEASTRLAEPIRLIRLTAAVSGHVSLRRFESAERLARATVELIGVEPPVPLSDGVFGFEGLVPGQYRIRAYAPGYDPVVRSFEAPAGRAVQIADIQLAHASTGDDAVWLDAHVRDDNGSVTGLTVDVMLDDMLFARPTTDREGRLFVRAAAADTYRLRVDASGFEPIESGPYIWSNESASFVDPDGARPALDLVAQP